MRIVIKVGTQSIISDDGTPIKKVIKSLVSQIIELRKKGHEIVLVSSGAVGLGRNIAKNILNKKYGSTIGEKQVLASLGQAELIHFYSNLFNKEKFAVSQLLLSRNDFSTRRNYLNIMRVLGSVLSSKNIIPIINENDSVAVEELMFTDNDELAGLIASQIKADKLVILSNVAGVYDGNPNEKGSKIIPIIDPKIGWPEIGKTKSAQGRGGMISKLATSAKASKVGITCHIASTSAKNILLDIVSEKPVGTTVLADKKKSNIKRWIAYNHDETIGSIVVNKRLNDILTDKNRTVSILPVGITEVHGVFQKSDTIKIINHERKIIGLGLAKYSSNELENLLGQKHQPEIIHYNYLYIY